MAKYSAFGTSLKRIATVIGQVTNIGGPSESMDTLDVTSHDSAGAWREFVGGLLDAGEVSVDLVFDPDNAGQISVRNDLVGRVPVSYVITFPDVSPATVTFNALVTGFEPDAPVDGDLSASVTLKATGAPVWA